MIQIIVTKTGSMGGIFNALKLSKKPSLTRTPLYLILPTVREVMFLLLPFLEFLIDLKALDGFWPEVS